MKPKTAKIVLAVTLAAIVLAVVGRMWLGGSEDRAVQGDERARQEQFKQHGPVPNESAPRAALPGSAPR